MHAKLNRHFPNRSLRQLALPIVACALAATFAINTSAKSEQVTQAPSGVMYVTGGASSEAVDTLKTMEKDFNLKLVFSNGAGAYLSDVKVTIADASGHTALDVTSEGPWVMAKLPAGAYTVDATFNGKTQRRNVNVAGGRLAAVDLQWAAN